MKRFLCITAVVSAMLFQGVQANAQQTHQHVDPLPRPTHKLPPLQHFPVRAADYEQYVQYYLVVLRSLPGRYHMNPGDLDPVILNLKECSSKIEADGYVTRREMDYCHNQMITKMHEVAGPYILQHAAGDF